MKPSIPCSISLVVGVQKLCFCTTGKPWRVLALPTPMGKQSHAMGSTATGWQARHPDSPGPLLLLCTGAVESRGLALPPIQPTPEAAGPHPPQAPGRPEWSFEESVKSVVARGHRPQRNWNQTGLLTLSLRYHMISPISGT